MLSIRSHHVTFNDSWLSNNRIVADFCGGNIDSLVSKIKENHTYFNFILKGSGYAQKTAKAFLEIAEFRAFIIANRDLIAKEYDEASELEIDNNKEFWRSIDEKIKEDTRASKSKEDSYDSSFDDYNISNHSLYDDRLDIDQQDPEVC